MTTETAEETYTLTIPRAQYDRLGSAEILKDDTYFRKYDPDEDTVKFVVSENQRCRFAAYASESNRENKKTGHLYWITQMFLEENIHTYMKG
jgi:hypothetical protein